jgi:UDP-perosamine 4-acetyltransferase
MNTAYIIGASGHGNVIASMIQGKYDTIIFVDQSPKNAQTIHQNDFFARLNEFKSSDIFLGVGKNEHRIKLYEQLLQEGKTPANCIAGNAFIAHDAVIGHGVVISPGAVIGSKAIIGNNTIINTLSSVDHDCVLGNHSQISPGVNLGGGTVVGENCFLGIKSATIPYVSIGNNAVIMAGSVVYQNIPENVMAGGIPARVVKILNQEVTITNH